VIGFLFLCLMLFIGSGAWSQLFVRPIRHWLSAQGLPLSVADLTAHALAVLVIALPAVVLFFVWLKVKLVGIMPDHVEFLPADPEDFAGLDQDLLLEYTVAFESLGFHQAFDYTVRTDVAEVNRNTGMGRLFINPELRCYAEVNQLFTAQKKAIPMRCNVISILEDGWTLSSGNREWAQVRAIWMWRRPRSLWTRHPGATPSEILDAHMERRQRIVHDLGLSLASDVSPRAYCLLEETATAERKQVFRRRNIAVALFEYWRVGIKPPKEWMGDYHRLARERGQGW
jgi:hypothetical protein